MARAVMAIVMLLALGLLGVGCIPPAKTTAALGMSEPVTEYRVEAKQFSFTPDVIRVAAGSKVRLIVTSVDVDHRLSINGLNPEREDVQGRVQTIEFTAWPKGTYSFDCEVSCGMPHDQMNGSLIVE